MKLPELVEKIARTFDLSDLRGLCFQLSIDFENLSGQNKIDKIISLVNHCKNRRKLEELVNQCKILRSQESWHFDESWYLAETIPPQQPNLRLWIAGTIVFALLIFGLVNFPLSLTEIATATITPTLTLTPIETSTETATLIPTKEPTDEPTNIPEEPLPETVPTETPVQIPPSNTPVPTKTPTHVPPTNTHTPIPPTNTATSIPAPFFVEDFENGDYDILSANDLPNIEPINPNNGSNSAIRIPKTEMSNDAWAVGTVWFPSGNVIVDSPHLVPGNSYVITVDVRSNAGVKCGVEFGHGASGHPDNGGYVINRNIAGIGEWQTITLAALTTEINRLQVNLRTYTDDSFCDFDNITILEQS